MDALDICFDVMIVALVAIEIWAAYRYKISLNFMKLILLKLIGLLIWRISKKWFLLGSFLFIYGSFLPRASQGEGRICGSLNVPQKVKHRLWTVGAENMYIVNQLINVFFMTDDREFDFCLWIWIRFSEQFYIKS